MATGLFNLKQVNQAISQGAWSGYIAPKWVEYLVVAGGGAGGASIGGGGGGGGLLSGIVTVAAGTSYTVTVGAGGSGSVSSVGNNGANSVFGAISSTGGGGGGAYDGNNGVAGGSGGGGGAKESGAQPKGGAGVLGQGNSGGLGMVLYSIYAGGGGGGAGTNGLSTVPATTYAANGGAGIASAITGSVVTYAGGGGGGVHPSGTAGAGGVGGGGAGASAGAVGTYGGGNTGGGGGGSSYNLTSASGGSGIVVVRYPGSVQFFTGGTLSYANGYMIHTFYASGTLAPTTPTPYVTDYQISRSLRFNSADSANLSRTPASATNQKTWTWSAWFKRGALSSDQVLFSAGGNGFIVRLNTPTDYLEIYNYSGGYQLQVITAQVFRDPSAWYHIVVVLDTTQATDTNRIKLYVNGAQVTSFYGTSTYPSQNANLLVNGANLHLLGRIDGFNQYFNGLMTEVNFIDGQALTPSSFGYTDPDTGVWSPLAFVGTYGTNGFYLNFSDNSNTTAATLGKDYSGNGNNWTPNNFSVTAGAGNDSMVDSPTSYGTDTGVGGTVRGNYATLNPLQNGMANAPTNGNLQIAGSADIYRSIFNTIGVSSGKWYFEVVITSGSGVTNVAWSSSTDIYQYAGSASTSYGYELENGNKINNGSTSAYGSALTTNDVFMCAADMDNLKLFFGKNGTWFASSDPVTGASPAYTFAAGTYFFQMRPYTGSSSVVTTNFGQRPFAYTAPSGFKALCTQNLPTPTIGATTATQATQYFNPVLYTGDRTDRTITVGFQPDWVWVKSRNAVDDHYLMNAVVGTGKYLNSNSTAAETTNANSLTAYTSTGFSIGNTGTTNETGRTYVAWNWKANGAGSTNTAGSITSTVSANTTSGFSVVTWTNSASANQTVGHGLGVTPSMIIRKYRSNADSWVVYHVSLGQTKYLELNTTGGAITDTNVWPNTINSTVFSTGNLTYFPSGWTAVAYCFAPVAGYSAFGTYTGNASADGPFIFTGFRPAYVLIKRCDTTSGGYWNILDDTRNTSNVVDKELYANVSNAEATFTAVDFTSNGIKIRTSDSQYNGSAALYLYMAFAETPLKFSLAR